VSVPVRVKAPPVPLLVPKVKASPEKQTAGAVPVGLVQLVPRSTGLGPEEMNGRRVVVGMLPLPSRSDCPGASKGLIHHLRKDHC
jgi:hypothetical protein